SVTGPLVGSACGGTYTRTWNISDACGNPATTRTQIITVDDTTAPVITGTITDTNIEGCSIAVAPAAQTTVAGIEALTGSLTISDNCSADTDITVSSSDNVSGSYPFVITRTYNVTDQCSNTSANFTHIIRVDDTTNPTISCPSNVTVTNTPSTCAEIISGIAPTTNDNCGVVLQTWTLSGATTGSSAATGINDASGQSFNVGTTTVTYYIEDAAGNSASCSFDVTVLDAAANASVLISATATTICENDSVIFTATPTDGGSPPSYQWYIGATPVGVNSATFDTNNPAHLSPINSLANGDAITVVMTSSLSACGTTATSNVINMTVNDSRPVSFSINASSTSICPGNSVTFSTGPITNGGSNPDYQWLLNGSPISGATNPTYTTNTLTGSETISLQLTSYVQCAVQQSGSNGIQVTVNSLPSVVANASDIEICLGDSVTLTGSGASSYTWDNGVTNNVAFSPTSTQTYTVTGTDANGCQNTDSITVTVNPLPSVVANASDIEICLGDSVTLTGSGASSYTWDNGVINNVAFSPTSTQTYTVTGTDANGCQNTDSITVTVNPLPSVVANASDIEICLGDSVTLTGSGASSYTWDNGITNNVAFSPTSTQTYTVTGTDANGCQNTDSITVTVNPLPTVSASNNGPVCIGDTINLNATFTNNGSSSSAVSYSWTGPNGFSSSLEDPSLTAVLASDGIYTVSVTDNNGCVNTATTTVTVTPDPSISLNTGNNNQQICSGDAIANIAYTIGGGGTGATLSWSPAITGSISGSYNSGTGIYTISGNITSGAGTYNYTVTTTGCNPITTTGSIEVFSATPGTPGIITSNASTAICPPATNITYTVPNDSNVATYQWILPDGFTITSGAGTNSITVNIAANADEDDVSVRATNPCGNSGLSSLEITIGSGAIADAGPDQYVCDGTPQITLAGFVGGAIKNANQWDWSDNGAGGTVPNSGGNNAQLNGTYTLPAVTTPGQIITITIATDDPGGVCGDAEDDMLLYILHNPTASISTSATPICEGTGSTVTFDVDAHENSDIIVTYNINGGANQTINLTTDASNPLGTASGNATYVLNTGALSSTTTYNLVSVAYTNNPTCTQSIGTSATVNVTPIPTASISYNGPFCDSETNPQSVTLNGTGAYTGGTYSAPAGLSINASGDIDPSNSTPGAYTVTYTIPASGGCGTETATTSVTITEEPTATISYNGPFCDSETNPQSVTLNGTGAYTGGTYSAPAGLSINTSSGAITPSASTPGIYTVTYTIPASGGCGTETATTSVTITEEPSATISYNEPFCNSETSAQSVVFSNTAGAYTGGTFTASPGGLTINSSTGAITPSTSSTGTYTITYTIPASSGCATETASTSVTIKEDVIITTQPQNVGVCESDSASLSVVAFGDDLSYEWFKVSSPSDISVGTNATLNFASTTLSDAGSYYVIVSGDTSCISKTSTTVTLNVNQVLTVTDHPDDVTECEGNSVTFNVTATGALAATNTYQWRKDGINYGSPTTSSSLTISPLTIADAGVYDVIIASAGGNCPNVTSNGATLTVTPLPVITNLSYSSSEYCVSDNTSYSPTLTGSNLNGGTYSYVANSGGSITGFNASTGAFNPTNTDIDTYTITYTIPASGGCSVVSEDFTFTIYRDATVNAGSNQTICSNSTATMNATLGGGGATSGTWSTSGDGGFNTPSLLNAVYTPGSNDVNSGNVTLTFTSNDPAGPCLAVSDTMELTIISIPTVDAGTDQTICSNEIVTLSGANFGGSATSAAWSIISGGGTLSSIAQTANPETVTYTPATGYSGNVTLRLTTNNPVAPCASQYDELTLTVQPYVAGGFTLEGYALDDQNNQGPVSSEIIACHEGNGQLEVSGVSATDIVEWQYLNSTVTDFTTVPIDPIGPGSTVGNAGRLIYNFTDVLTNAVDGATAFRVVVNTGSACGDVYSDVAYVSVIPSNLKPEPVQASPIEYCLGGTSTFSSSVNFGGETLNTEGGFDNGQLNTNDPDGWLVDGELGRLSASGNSVNQNNWSVTNDGKTYHTGVTYDNDIVSPPTNEGKFAIAYGYYNTTGVGGHPVIFDPDTGNRITTMETPIFSLMTIQDAVLEFREAYYLEGAQNCFTDETHTTTEPAPAAELIIELSTDGGANYDIELRPTITGPASTPANYQDFADVSLDLSDYFGQTNLRVRWTFVRNCSSSWAIDGITLPGVGGVSEVEWTDEFGNVLPVIAGTNNVMYTPYAPGYQKYTVTTYINGCRSLAPDGSEDVFLTVHYANAGPAPAPVTIDNCGSNVSLHAYDNRLSPRDNYDEYAAENTWEGWYLLPGDDPDDGWTPLNPNPFNGSDFDPTLGPGDIPGTWSISNYMGPNIVDTNAPENYFSDVNDPKAEFSGPGGDYTLTWTTPNSGDDGDCSSDVTVTLTDCSTLDFDGENDNVTFRNNYDLSGSFSFEVWVKPDATTETGLANNNIQTIFSKRDATNVTHGYDLRLEGNTLSFNYNGSTAVTASPIGTDRWYHVAVTYDGTYTLYVDGIEMDSGGSGVPTSNNYEFILGAMDQNPAGGNPNPVNYYSGWMQELRIWDVALTVEQIRQMMNQRIHDNGLVEGDIVPIDVAGLNWASLRAYYQMVQASEIVGGYLIPTGGTGATNGQLRNIETTQDETAPLPYFTKAIGNWNTTGAGTPWQHGDSVWDHPNSTGINGQPIDWNIAQIRHDVISNTQDVILLGLLVDVNRELTVTNTGTQDETNTGHGLWVTHYLLLDGLIDLIGESQLVQKRYTGSAGISITSGTTNQVTESILDVNSSGYIERDQQGTNNPFNYNYWGSPVGPRVTGTNNNPRSVGGTMMDGSTSAMPQNITFTGTYTAPDTDPISVSTRWMYAYENYTNNTYAAWRRIGNTVNFNAGLGHIMKGSGNNYVAYNIGTQNYVFTGKPNNNTITTPINDGYDALVGNPYASAIDANAFLIDNGPTGTNTISGALYFWEHYVGNNTHILAQYEGGYAVLNLVGGIAAATPPPTAEGYEILGGTGTKVPERYIPVGQGFFVTAADLGPDGNGVGGQIEFNNDQRVFVREALTGLANSGSVFLKSNNTKKGNASGTATPQNGTASDDIKRLRIDFKTPEGAIRQLLLGFIPGDKATDNVDYGYDAPKFNNFPNDLTWIINGKGYEIQGVGEFDEAKLLPLGLYLGSGGTFEIILNDMDGLDPNTKVYVYDSLLGTYTKINNKSFEMNLEAGDYLDRFFLTFQKNNTLSFDNDNALDSLIGINYLQNSKELYIKTPVNINVKQIYLTNILGQTIKSWNVSNTPNLSTNEIRIPISKVAEGTYIVKVETLDGSTNKKIVIQQ
ncbi:HYR domain-containing protein, partial [Seonamhaeicola sediminis]